MVAIQPCALLLLIGPDWQIETVSANVAMLGDDRPASVVGQPLADLIGSKAIHALRNRMSWLSSDESEVSDFGAQWGEVTLDLRATRGQDNYLVEAELAVEPRLPDGIGMVRSMSDRLSGSDPLALATQAMQQIAAVAGFERVILANRRGEPMASNNRKPSSDVPRLPVELTRIVADRDAEPVQLVGDAENELLLRTQHLTPEDDLREQLEKAAIGATMSLPLRIDGELVGAIHAYHGSPRRTGAERRSVIHLFAERLVARMARQGWQP
jgi:light-regulated signal transduction histidine kinase (bacteriophytochrome)